MADVSSQLYKAPWQTPNQFAAYCKAIERSRQVLAKRQERQAELVKNRCAKEAHSDDFSAAREAKVQREHASKREKLREMIRATKEVPATEKDEGPSRITLVTKRSTIVMAPQHATSPRKIASVDSVLVEMPVEETRRVRTQHFVHDDEVGLIDIDEGTSDEDDDSTQGELSGVDDFQEDPRFIAALLSDWDEIERSQSLTSALVGRNALLSGASTRTKAAQARSVAMMLASERPNALRALLTLEAKRRRILQEDEEEALHDAVGRWQKLHYHIHHSERLIAVRMLNLNDQESARRTVVDVKEQQAWKLLMTKERGQSVQAKHRQTVRENMTAKEAYWANARQKEIQKLKEMAERMLMDVKHHTQEEDPINRMPPRQTRLASAIFSTLPAARRSTMTLATPLDMRGRRPSATPDSFLLANRRPTALLTKSPSFTRRPSLRRETVAETIPDDWSASRNGGDEETGGLTEKQKHAMNERWQREAKMFGDKLRKELVAKEHSPEHTRVYDQMEAQREALKVANDLRNDSKNKIMAKEVSEHFSPIADDINTVRKQSEDQLKDPFFLKLEEARRKKHADMVTLLEKAEAGKTKSLTNVVDLVLSERKDVHGEEVLEPAAQQPLTRWFRERSIVHTNFFTGRSSPTSPSSILRKPAVSLHEGEAEHVSFDDDQEASALAEVHSLSFGGFGADSRPTSIALASFNTSQDAATIQTDSLDETMNREGVRRRSSAFYKLREISQTVIALRRLSCGRSLEESAPSPTGSTTEFQDLNMKRERQNLATLVVATGLGRKNVEATRRENLQSLDETGSPIFKRNQSVQSKPLSNTPAMVAPSFKLPPEAEYTAFSDHIPRHEPDLRSTTDLIDRRTSFGKHLLLSRGSDATINIAEGDNGDDGDDEERDEEGSLSLSRPDPCAQTLPVGALRPPQSANAPLPPPSAHSEAEPPTGKQFPPPRAERDAKVNDEPDEWVLAEDDFTV